MSNIDDLDCDALISRLVGSSAPPDRDASAMPPRKPFLVFRAGAAVASLWRTFFRPPTEGRARWAVCGIMATASAERVLGPCATRTLSRTLGAGLSESRRL